MKNKGFTLVEILATIAILAIVVIIVFSTNGDILGFTKTWKNEVLKKNVLNGAKTFSQEIDESAWVKNDDKDLFCIDVRGLIYNGYFKDNEISESSTDEDEITKETKILVTRNLDTEVIDKVEIDTNNTCDKFANTKINIKSFTDNSIDVEADCGNNNYYKYIIYNEQDELIKQSSIISNSSYIFDSLEQNRKYFIKVQCYSGTTDEHIIKGKEGKVEQSTGASILVQATSKCSSVPATIKYDKVNSDVLKFTLNNSNAIIDSKYKVRFCDSTDILSSDNGNITVEKNQEYCIDKENFLNEGAAGNIGTVTMNIEQTTDISVNASGSIEGKNFTATNTENIVANKCVSDPTCKSNLVYNKTEQVLTEDADEGYSFANNTGTNAGTYQVTATLSNGYSWNDGTVTNKILNCKIHKANPVIAITPTSSTSKIGETKTFTYKSNMAGQFNFSSNSVLIATVQDSTKTVSANTTYTQYVTASNAGLATITSVFKPSDSTNYNNVVSEYKINVSNDYAIYDIYLNAGSSYSTRGTTYVYEKYNVGVYLDSSTSKKMTTSSNKITIPTRSGYDFYGYYTKNGGGGIRMISYQGYKTANFDSTYFSGDSTLYAYWVKQEEEATTPTTYTLTYNNQSGSGCSSTTFTPDTKFSNYECTPSRSGYTFDGWYTSTNGSGTKYTSSTYMPSKNLTLYANWIAVDTVNGYRCDTVSGSGRDNKYYITTCTEDTCNYTKKNGVSSSGTISRNILKPEASCYYDEINGSRCYNNNSIYVTYCQSSSTANALCKYSQIGGNSSEGTVFRNDLRTECSVNNTLAHVNNWWNIYKVSGYVLDSSCSSDIYSYHSNACSPSSDNAVSLYYVGATNSNTSVYLKTNSNGTPAETVSYSYDSTKNKLFIKIYVSTSNINFSTGKYGCTGGSSSKISGCSDGSIVVNGTTYYGVWIAYTCNKSDSTCSPTGKSMDNLTW